MSDIDKTKLDFAKLLTLHRIIGWLCWYITTHLSAICEKDPRLFYADALAELDAKYGPHGTLGSEYIGSGKKSTREYLDTGLEYTKEILALDDAWKNKEEFQKLIKAWERNPYNPEHLDIYHKYHVWVIDQIEKNFDQLEPRMLKLIILRYFEYKSVDSCAFNTDIGWGPDSICHKCSDFFKSMEIDWGKFTEEEWRVIYSVPKPHRSNKSARDWQYRSRQYWLSFDQTHGIDLMNSYKTYMTTIKKEVK